jgi:hypothetical protein
MRREVAEILLRQLPQRANEGARFVHDLRGEGVGLI